MFGIRKPRGRPHVENPWFNVAGLPALPNLPIGPQLIEQACSIWNSGPNKRGEREQHYLSWLYANIREYGFGFLRDLSVEITKQTLTPLINRSHLPVTDPNMVLARLLVLYNRAGIYFRHTNGKKTDDTSVNWQQYCWHPATIFAHGKRVIIEGVNIEKIFNDWLLKNHKPFKRFSSHDLIFPKDGSNWRETKSIWNALEGKTDRGLNLALFGLNKMYPYRCVSNKKGLYDSCVIQPGRFGHLCISPVDNTEKVIKQAKYSAQKRKFSRATIDDLNKVFEQSNPQNQEQIGFIGVENNAPGKTSPHGYGHGISCTENPLSAFWVPKWGDREMVCALDHFALRQDVPNQNHTIPGKGYGKIKIVVPHSLAQEIMQLTDNNVLDECNKILANPAYSSPIRRVSKVFSRSPFSNRSPVTHSMQWMMEQMGTTFSPFNCSDDTASNSSRSLTSTPPLEP